MRLPAESEPKAWKASVRKLSPPVRRASLCAGMRSPVASPRTKSMADPRLGLGAGHEAIALDPKPLGGGVILPESADRSRRSLKEVAAGRVPRLARHRQPDQRIGSLFRRKHLVGVRRKVLLHGFVAVAREPRRDDARMYGVDDDPMRRCPFRQGSREEDRGQLGIAIGLSGDEVIEHLQVAPIETR